MYGEWQGRRKGTSGVGEGWGMAGLAPCPLDMLALIITDHASPASFFVLFPNVLYLVRDDSCVTFLHI